MLSDAVRFEVRRGSAPPTFFNAAEARLHPLDLEDVVYIHVDKEALSQFAAAPPTSSTLEKTHQQVAKLQDMLSAIGTLAPIAVEIAEARKQILTGKMPQGEEYKALIRRYEISWRDTKRAVRTYLEASLSEPAKAEERLNDLVKDPTNKVLADFLSSEINRQSRQTQGAIEDASRDAPLGLRLQAAAMRRKKGGTPIHLDGYDDGEPGQIQFRDKLSFAQSPDRQKEIDESLQTAAAVKGTIDAIRSDKRNLVAIMRESYAPQILEAAGLPDPQLVKTHLGEMRNHAAKLADLTAQSVDLKAAYAGLIGNASKAAREITLPTQFEGLIEKARSIPKSKTDADLLAAVRSIADSLPSSQQMSGVITDLRIATSTLSGIIGAAAVDAVPAQTTAEIKETLASLNQDADGLAQDFLKLEQFASRVASWNAKDVLKLTDTGNLLAGVDAAQWTAFTIPLTQVRDTWIDMNTVAVDDGDKLIVSARVLQMNGASEDGKTISSFSGQIPITSLGWSSSVSGDLLFAQRQRTNRFVTATGISYVYKYRPWDQTTRWNRFLTILNPGIGLTVAALNFPGDSIQTGVGLTATFLDGLISAGYGYNLQAGTNPGFVFMGVRFTGVAQQIKSVKGG